MMCGNTKKKKNYIRNGFSLSDTAAYKWVVLRTNQENID